MTTDQHSATATMTNLPISTKQSVEICSAVRGKSLQKAREFLLRVVAMEEAVPYRRFKMNVAHKPGHIAAGRYPLKSAKTFLKLFDSVESNAEDKGLDKDRLYIQLIMANKAASRIRGIKARNTHVKIIVAEWEVTEKKREPKTEAPKNKEQKK